MRRLKYSIITENTSVILVAFVKNQQDIHYFIW